MRVTMDAEGRIVIPAEIRDEAGLSAGAPLDVHVRNGKVEIALAPIEEALAVQRTLSLVSKRADAVRQDRPATDHPQLDLLIRMAIAHRRIVELVYDNRRKRVEPHDYGIRSAEPQLLVYQQSGESRSGDASGWRSLKLARISDFRVLDESFPGGRPADRHIDWELLLASVSK